MSETTKCAKCGKWFVPIPERKNASCCVMHGPNDCCHFAEREVAPPTPDLDAVVARVRRSLDGLADDETFPDGTGYTFGYAADKRGTWVEMTVGDLRALLAAVARPAEAREETKDWAEHVAFVVGAEWAALTYLPTGPAGFYELAEAEAARRYPLAAQHPSES